MKEAIAVTDSTGKILKNDDTLLPIYSITKTMIASIVLDLGISLESAVSKWIPDSVCPHIFPEGDL